MSQFRERSPVRGRPPAHPGEASAEVGQVTYLGQGDINSARAALGSALAAALDRWNSTFVGSNTRLIPPGPAERNTEFYIFPLMYDKLSSPSDLEHFLNSELAVALDGRRARLRIENNSGRSSAFIDVPVSRPESEKPRVGNNKGGLCNTFMSVAVLMVLAVNLAAYIQRHYGSTADFVHEF